jgi:hypothetical protein
MLDSPIASASRENASATSFAPDALHYAAASDGAAHLPVNSALLEPLPEIPSPGVEALQGSVLDPLPEIPPPDMLMGFLCGKFSPDFGPVSLWVDAITQAVHYHHIPVAIQQNIHNVFCEIIGQCKRDEFVVYDPEFVTEIAHDYGPEAAIGAIAHEVGHAYYGVNVPLGVPDWTDEMHADFFAGQILRCFNLDPAPFFKWLGSLTPDFRHPDGSTRDYWAQLGYSTGVK